MYNTRLSIGTQARQNNFFKTSLGNSPPRYNSQVTMQRRKYLVNSSRNSQDVPQWMSRTQNHHFRQRNQNRSLFTNAASPFKIVQQTYVYARQPKFNNPEAQFQNLPRNKTRSQWEMKNHTFEFQWPKNDVKTRQNPVSQSSIYETTFRPSSRQNQISRIQLAKYAYKQTPLHVQRQTQIKIGHPYVLNSTYIK